MAKINFSETHMNRLKELACKMLFANGVIYSANGLTPLNIVELIHTQTPTQLNNIKAGLDKKINQIESRDEWLDPDNSKLDTIREARELVNLIVGWKRLNIEKAENARKKEELTKKLAELKESTKTPEDRIKEMEAQLKELEDF